MRIVDWLDSRDGQKFRLVLETTVSVLAFLWLLKNHKIIKK